jgi:hypothetical protein
MQNENIHYVFYSYPFWVYFTLPWWLLVSLAWVFYKLGIPVEGGKTRDPRQKRSDGVDDDFQHEVCHTVCLLPFRDDF